MLILMIIAAAFAALANALQVGQTILSWNWLTAAGYSPSPLYTLFKGALFFLLFLVSAITLSAHMHWAPGFSAGTTVAAFLWSWIDRLMLNRTPGSTGSQLFLVILSLVVLSIVEFSLYLLVPYMKQDLSKRAGANNNE